MWTFFFEVFMHFKVEKVMYLNWIWQKKLCNKKTHFFTGHFFLGQFVKTWVVSYYQEGLAYTAIKILVSGACGKYVFRGMRWGQERGGWPCKNNIMTTLYSTLLLFSDVLFCFCFCFCLGGRRLQNKGINNKNLFRVEGCTSFPLTYGY